MAKYTSKLDKLSLTIADRFNAEEEYRKACEAVTEALHKKRLAEARFEKAKAKEAKAKAAAEKKAGGHDARLVTCMLCHAETPEATAHRHQDGWICDDNCWDERLKTSE